MSRRILAKNYTASNDSMASGINLHDLIIGPSGAGKTRGYVIPNILQCNESMLVADTKGNLAKDLGPVLRDNGYEVIAVDFKNMADSFGYNPFDCIGVDERKNHCQQDILRIANILCPTRSLNDPYWEGAARQYLAALIAYTLECLPKNECHLSTVAELLCHSPSGVVQTLMNELAHQHPASFAVSQYRLYNVCSGAMRTQACVLGILAEKLNGLVFDDAIKMYTQPVRIHFEQLGKKKTAIFLTISDIDRSKDRLVSLFYAQALQALVGYADSCPGSRLPVPVRFILDDFATNAYIHDFDNIIATVRSRGIAISIILQSLTQLEALYGPARAESIVNNCDTCIYLGGQDIHTADFISAKADIPRSAILQMPVERGYLFVRGQAPTPIRKYDLADHPLYRHLAESKQPKGFEYTKG